MNLPPPEAKIRAHYTPAPTRLWTERRHGREYTPRKPARNRLDDSRPDLMQEINHIGHGDGLGLTDRQRLLLLRLPDREEIRLRATAVYNRRLEFYSRFDYLTCMSDAFLRSISFPRQNMPACLGMRPGVEQQKKMSAEALWFKRYPGGYDCPEAKAEVEAMKASNALGGRQFSFSNTIPPIVHDPMSFEGHARLQAKDTINDLTLRAHGKSGENIDTEYIFLRDLNSFSFDSAPGAVGNRVLQLPYPPRDWKDDRANLAIWDHSLDTPEACETFASNMMVPKNNTAMSISDMRALNPAYLRDQIKRVYIDLYTTGPKYAFHNVFAIHNRFAVHKLFLKSLHPDGSGNMVVTEVNEGSWDRVQQILSWKAERETTFEFGVRVLKPGERIWERP